MLVQHLAALSVEQDFAAAIAADALASDLETGRLEELSRNG